jgi:3',5'-cyclic AMP phosphodiesterase CpdA
VRFAVITDLHFGRAAPFRGVDRKLTGHAPALTATFVDDMNGRVRPDFVMVLGDVIEDESPDADIANYREATAILSGLDMPVHYVYGNHDLVHLSHDQLLKSSGSPALNSSFDVDGWHLVRLHSTVDCEPTGSPGDGYALKGYVAREHLDWLDRDLAAASEPAIVVCRGYGCAV